jgi:parallel beta-helix repeat protein
MNKQFTRFVAGLIAVLLCGAFFISSTSSNASFSLLNSAVASSRTVYVDINNAADPSQDGSSSHPFSTMQKGIDNANAGDTVFVRKGHYFETVAIPRSVNLVGENRDNTIIDGLNTEESGVVVSIDLGVGNVRISNLTIVHASAPPHHGLDLAGYNNNVEISGDNISKFDVGINIGTGSEDITITHNDILVLSSTSGVAAGVYFSNNNVNISGNSISGVGPNNYGIYGYGENTTVLGNSLKNINDGIDVGPGGSIEVIGNTETNVTLGIDVYECYNSIFEDNNINSTIGLVGIYDRENMQPYPENNTFSNNTVVGCDYGLYLENSAGTSHIANETVVCNEFQNCGTGVYVDQNLTYSYIYHNNFVNNTYQAIDEGQYNSWTKYPCGGNYWNDYSGSDTHWGEKQDRLGSDFLGDTAYTSVSYGDMKPAKDGYPLMNPWPMSNFWYSEDFKVSAITSSLITNYKFDNNTGISFNVSITKTNGSSVMIIPKSLLDGAFNFFVDNVSAVCSLDWSNQYHKVSFSYGPGSHNVRITAEFMGKSLTQFPDLNGDGRVGIQDLVILAQHWGEHSP